MGIGIRKPSPAMVVACVALTVALSGTGYAALRLPRNSVGPKQLRNSAVTSKKLAKGAVTNTKLGARAVTGGKVAANTLTGAHVNEATLGVVPNATHATSADTATSAGTATTAATAQSLAAPEAFHLVGTAGEPAFENSWRTVPTTTFAYPGGFFKDHDGIVHLSGRLNGGSGNTTIFKLPPGYRPRTLKALGVTAACECTGGQSAILAIFGSGFDPSVAGAVALQNSTLAASGSLYLDGISFRAES